MSESHRLLGWFGYTNGDDPKVAAVGQLSTLTDQAVGVAPSTRWMSGFICWSC
jgi:hypothetical protein